MGDKKLIYDENTLSLDDKRICPCLLFYLLHHRLLFYLLHHLAFCLLQLVRIISTFFFVQLLIYNPFIGKYCLVDGGLPHTNKLMAPYRGVRYHLKEYSMRGPQNSKELFNLLHASLRNTIERAFCVLKRRYPIIRNEDHDINLEDEVMQEILNGPQEQDRRNSTETNEGNRMAEQLRNSIANEMWANYLTHSNN
uniref:DDE Tnp4 domain-containing protein n=1 Tax=Lactuca sativa TaxID=4236 RepID=A0A9R1X1N2_LACSA|nr:hypothetical protein LSAT_V11C700359910 [Lactuca sativa]